MGKVGVTSQAGRILTAPAAVGVQDATLDLVGFQEHVQWKGHSVLVKSAGSSTLRVKGQVHITVPPLASCPGQCLSCIVPQFLQSMRNACRAHESMLAVPNSVVSEEPGKAAPSQLVPRTYDAPRMAPAPALSLTSTNGKGEVNNEQAHTLLRLNTTRNKCPQRGPLQRCLTEEGEGTQKAGQLAGHSLEWPLRALF